jgi:PAS domain S-box-containing protein
MSGSGSLLPDDAVGGLKELNAENTLPLELYKKIVESTSAAHFIIVGNKFIYANPAFVRLIGYSDGEIGSFSVSRFFSCDLATLEAFSVKMSASPPLCSGHRHFEAKVTCRDGESRILAVTIVPVEIDFKPAIFGTAIDITLHKKREEFLEQSELKYRTVFELAPDLIMIYTPDGIAIDINPVGADLIGIPPDEDPRRLGALVTWTEEYKDKFEKIREETLRDGGWFGEVHGVRPDGQGFVVETRAKVAKLGEETIIIVISRDITERKRMEERIRTGLREKETLLREIHHRVKNNMQIISTLLKLQLRNSDDARTRALFRESRNRILSMAMIHEKLYQSEGLHRVDLKEYIGDLVHEVFASFGETEGRVDLQLQVEDIALGLDTAIPCGLIIIELVSNSLKYAFPEGRKGRIFVNLHAEDGWFRLTVGDDGVGMAETLEIGRLSSLGLRLVSDLSKYQLEGKMSLAGANGTEVNVRFQEKQKNSGRKTHNPSTNFHC